MATHRLLGTFSGVTSFAEVSVERSGSLNGTSASASAGPWLASAIRGVEDAWTLSGRLGDPWRTLVVSDVAGTVVDTTADAVRTAALLAALECLGVADSELPEVRLTESGWILVDGGAQ